MHRSAECCREAMNVPRGQALHSFVAASRNMPSPQNFSLVTVVVVVVEVVVEAQTTSDAAVPVDLTNSFAAQRLWVVHRSAECCCEAMYVPRGQVWHLCVDASRNMPSPQTISVVVVVVVVVEVVVEAQTTSDVAVPADWMNSSAKHARWAMQPTSVCCTNAWKVPRGHVLHRFDRSSR